MTLGWDRGHKNFETPGAPQGNLEAWSEAANKLFAAGCEPQGFALLCSFAAPLISLFPNEDGGAVVSIHGAKRAGKSVAQTAASTVWALPKALELLGRDRYSGLANLRHLPACITTLASMDPFIAKRFVEDFHGGVGPRGDWSTIMLSFSGEALNLKNVFEMELRVPRGLIDARDKNTPSILEQNLMRNRGTAGAAYIKEILPPHRVLWCKKMLSSRMGLLIEENRLAAEQVGEMRYTLRCVAACWIAAIICTDHGILEMSPDRIVRWAIARALAPLSSPASRRPRRSASPAS